MIVLDDAGDLTNGSRSAHLNEFPNHNGVFASTMTSAAVDSTDVCSTPGTRSSFLLSGFGRILSNQLEEQAVRVMRKGCPTHKHERAPFCDVDAMLFAEVDGLLSSGALLADAIHPNSLDSQLCAFVHKTLGLPEWSHE